MDDLEQQVYDGLIAKGLKPKEAKEVFGSLFSETVFSDLSEEFPIPEEQLSYKDFSADFNLDACDLSAERLTYKEFLRYFTESIKQTKPIVPVFSKMSSNISLVLLLSDWHSGKKVEQNGIITYNREIRDQRVNQVVSELICYLQSTIIEFDELVICLLGDMVDGHGIYRTQAYHQDERTLEQSIGTDQLLWQLIVTMLDKFKQVRVHCVPGNHGRSSKDAPECANWDNHVYSALSVRAEILNDPRLYIEASKDNYLNIEVQGKRIHLRHKAPPQAETAAAFKRFSGYYDKHRFDIMCYGHLHHPAMLWHQNRPLIMCGSLVGTDSLSEEMAVESRPMQTMFTVPGSPMRPIGQKIPIYLD